MIPLPITSCAIKKIGARRKTSDLAVLRPVLVFMRLTLSSLSSEHYIMDFIVLNVISEPTTKSDTLHKHPLSRNTADDRN